MSKKHAEHPARPPLTEGQPSTDPQYKFNRFMVTRLSFQELPLAPLAEGETRPTVYALEVGLNLTAGISSEGKDSEVRMAVRVTADPRVKPYVIEVEVLGQFSMVSGTPENFQMFVHRLAPAILFPYVREIVDRTTIDGRYGVVRLDPMNLQAAINHDDWKPVETPAIVGSSAP